ncbi:endonuclease [Bacillus lacus]|uniref:Endonuclease n=1 Tax=Metabacillus lacus TaxID=1983721 RepID=A0A7X2IWM2_9BACI|nr:endonuclease/exonuclease/phosphatase family protein [Metabacillus lacus]MRX71177.1 endonuclease [Metabacillus lacus]
MKLLTLNCHSWQEDDQLSKIKILAESIKDHDYDVIALQEVSQHIEEPFYDKHIRKNNYALVLLEELQNLGIHDYQLSWDVSHIGYDVYEEGSAIITKHPIVRQGSFFVSKNENISYWKTRKVVFAEVEIENQLMMFYSCHLGWWKDDEEPFRYQADSLLRMTDTGQRAFLMGDFNNNAFIRGEGYDYLIQKGLTDTYTAAEDKDAGITVKGEIAGWDRNKSNLRLDLILTNMPAAVSYSKVIFNGINREVVSDHYGVETNIIL